jgi:hypothetical protein
MTDETTRPDADEVDAQDDTEADDDTDTVVYDLSEWEPDQVDT